MNEFQTGLYNDLLALTKTDGETFFFADNVEDEVTYRIFSYRISTYSKWLYDSALECRGITFEVKDELPVRLASWPFEKFFNRNENPMTSDLDYSKPTEILLKEDGSLISSMLLADGKLYLKSKGSLHSKQAKAAMKMLLENELEHLCKWIHDWTKRGYTVIMEYTSPLNQIVVPYKKSALTILAIRNNADGSYVDLFNLALAPETQSHVVKNLVADVVDAESFVDKIPKEEGIEGYVIRLASGQRVKIKTEWYVSLHGLSCNNVLSDDGLIKAVLGETIDDVRSLFHDTPEVMEMIDKVESKVSTVYNHTVNVVKDFHGRNQHLPKREYAISGQKELTRVQFGLAMQLFVGKRVDFADAVYRNRDKLDLVDL